MATAFTAHPQPGAQGQARHYTQAASQGRWPLFVIKQPCCFFVTVDAMPFAYDLRVNKPLFAPTLLVSDALVARICRLIEFFE